MIIPEIDQDLATIKANYIQYINDYHISDSDFAKFSVAVSNLMQLHRDIAYARRVGEY